jgi:hypothetical protein
VEAEFSDETEAAGESNLVHLIKSEGHIDEPPKTLKGGHDHEIAAILEIIAAAIALLREMIELYPVLKRSLNRQPLPTELADKALKGKSRPPAEVESKKLQLAERVIVYRATSL